MARRAWIWVVTHWINWTTIQQRGRHQLKWLGRGLCMWKRRQLQWVCNYVHPDSSYKWSHHRMPFEHLYCQIQSLHLIWINDMNQTEKTTKRKEGGKLGFWLTGENVHCCSGFSFCCHWIEMCVCVCVCVCVRERERDFEKTQNAIWLKTRKWHYLWKSQEMITNSRNRTHSMIIQSQSSSFHFEIEMGNWVVVRNE